MNFMEKPKSIQQEYSPNGICFGCGPANEKGLQINSFPDGIEVVADGMPSRNIRRFRES